MLIGDIDIHPVADGTFRASPAYFGDHARPDGHEDLFTRHGMAWLPIGCFLVRTGDRTILIDAGVGPEMRDDGPRRLLVGGQLLLGLRAAGVTAPATTDVVCTHLHADHCGWLLTATPPRSSPPPPFGSAHPTGTTSSPTPTCACSTTSDMAFAPRPNLATAYGPSTATPPSRRASA